MSLALRRTLMLLLLDCAASASLLAQENPFELSLVVVPSGSYSEYEGSDFDLGYGLGLGWAYSEHWSAELRGLRRENDSEFAHYELDTYELGLRRRFRGADDWRPFVLFGALYQEAKRESPNYCVATVTFPCPPDIQRNSESGAFVGGGVDWNFTPHFALRLDGRGSIYESDSTGDADVRVDLTAGLVLRF